jgi:hypothetical protein
MMNARKGKKGNPYKIGDKVDLFDGNRRKATGEVVHVRFDGRNTWYRVRFFATVHGEDRYEEATCRRLRCAGS